MVGNSRASDSRFEMHVVGRWLELTGFVIGRVLDEAVGKRLEMHVK